MYEYIYINTIYTYLYIFKFLGPTVVEAVKSMNDGDVILLENLRFYPEEVIHLIFQ
jgi:3-phosphoglycerate kinase